MKLKNILSEMNGMPVMKVLSNPLAKAFSVVNEAEDDRYTHIGYGKYKEKGKEDDKSAPTFTKTDSGKYIPTKGGEDKPQDTKGGVNIFDKDYDGGNEEPKQDEPNQDTPKDNPFGVDRLVYNKRTKTVGIVRMADDGYGEVKTDADGNVSVDELEPFNPMKYPHQNDAKVAPSTSKEIDSRGLFQPFAQNGPIIREPKSEPSQPKREGDPQVNKETLSNAKKLGITPQKLGKEEYQKKMAQAAVAALTDANYHTEARELIAKLEGKPEWAEDPRKSAPSIDSPEYDDWAKSSVYSSEYYDAEGEVEELGIEAANSARWDGEKAADSIAFTLRQNGFDELADSIQSVIKENKSTKLKDLL
jgi:hypothetical protein